MAVVSDERRDASAPLAFSSLSNHPTSCMFHHTACESHAATRTPLLSLSAGKDSEHGALRPALGMAISPRGSPLQLLLHPSSQVDIRRVKRLSPAMGTRVSCLAEHGLEEKGTQATREALAHSRESVLLQDPHHYSPGPDARKHQAPL